MSENGPGTGQILVALDGSSPAQAAASSAIHIASTQHLSIRGLNVVSSRLVMEPYSNYLNFARNRGVMEPEKG